MVDDRAGIRVGVDLTNPGQFLACCGLLELADRHWNGAEGWFEFSPGTFWIVPIQAERGANASDLVDAMIQCEMVNTMTADQVRRREALGTMKKRERSREMEEEKWSLDRSWREAAMMLRKPFNLRIDWWLDGQNGGSRLKTWAGQQSVIEIARNMRQMIRNERYQRIPSEDWLFHVGGEGVSFHFDSDLGSQASNLDIGFSLDPLGISPRIRPLVELAAFVGLQRFRPAIRRDRGTYTYTAWSFPLSPSVAAAAVRGCPRMPGNRSYEFPLRFRTKYLKSFLPAMSRRD